MVKFFKEKPRNITDTLQRIANLWESACHVSDKLQAKVAVESALYDMGRFIHHHYAS